MKAYFEDCSVGDRVITPGRTITETDIVQFAGMTGDWNPWHCDKEYAAEHTSAGERFAHGLLVLSIGTGLLSRVGWFEFWPEKFVAITSFNRVRFVRPVVIGDTIHLDAKIVKAIEVDDTQGTLESLMRIKNQYDELVLNFIVTVLVHRRGSDE